MFERALFVSLFLVVLKPNPKSAEDLNHSTTLAYGIERVDDIGIRIVMKVDTAECVTPDSKPGNCIPIQECKKLYDLLVYKGYDQITQTHLKRSQCGKRGSYPPYVCCPPSSVSAAPLTSSSDCGKTSVETWTKVVGGQPVALGTWPWMAALFCQNASDHRQRFQCGGTLISDQWVVTAGHCLSCPDRKMKLSYVRLGDLDLDDTVDDGATPIDVPISEIISHPKYRGQPLENDVALLRLSKPVVFSDHIRPVCLPSNADYRSDSYYHKIRPIVAGWGAISYRNVSSSRLLEANLNVVNISKCVQDYANLSSQAVVDSRVICAGSKGKDSCQGDSGGPLVFSNSSNGRYYLAGIVSFGVGCANQFPGVYTKVAEFVDWISQSTKLTF